MKYIIVLVLLSILASCSGNPAYPDVAMRMESVNPYPFPEEDNNTPQYCRGAVEIPIAVWTEDQFIYSQLCGVALAGSELIIHQGNKVEQVSGRYVESNSMCFRYIHYPTFNGDLIIEAIMLDAGGQTLCDLNFINREWHILPVISNNVNIYEKEKPVKRAR